MIRVQSQIQPAIMLDNVTVPWVTKALNVINVWRDYIKKTQEDVKVATAMNQEALAHPVKLVYATVKPLLKVASVLNVSLMIDMVSIVNHAIVMSEENGTEHARQMVSVIAKMVLTGENVVIVRMAFTDEIVRHVDVMSLVAQV